MIRNLPIRITTEILEQQLEQMGLAGKYDLLHIPRDAHKPDCSLGYAFINLRDAAVASQVERAAKGLSWASFSNSEKVCEVEFARVQGLEALKRRFAQRTRDAVHAPHLIHGEAQPWSAVHPVSKANVGIASEPTTNQSCERQACMPVDVIATSLPDLQRWQR